MRELAGFMEFVTDGIRGKLAYTRARGERGSQEPREKINPVRLTKNMTYLPGYWTCSVLSRHKQGQIRVDSRAEKPATLRTSARVWTSERH